MALPIPSSQSSALTELDPDFEPAPPSSPPFPIHASRRASKRSSQEKITQHLNNLREDGLSAADFLLLLQNHRPLEWRNCIKKLHTPAYHSVISGLLDPSNHLEVLQELQWGIPILEEEIKRLGTYGSAFGQWTDRDAEDLSHHLDFRTADYVKQAKDLSPCLFGLLQKLLTQYDTKAEVKEMRAVFILALICHSRSVKKSNSLQMQLGLHLHAGGVQRRIIDLFSRLGVCCGYKAVLAASKRVSEVSKGEIATLGSCPESVTAYDNFEQSLGVKGQRLGENGEFHSVTTGEVLLGREMPPGGLFRNMFKRFVPLRSPQLFCAPGSKKDATEAQVQCHH
jgi:hypothetical protein